LFSLRCRRIGGGFSVEAPLTVPRSGAFLFMARSSDRRFLAWCRGCCRGIKAGIEKGFYVVFREDDPRSDPVAGNPLPAQMPLNSDSRHS